MTEEELNQYISDPDNGLVQEKNINGIEYKLTYRPVSQILNQEFGSGKENSSVREVKRKEYERFHYFVMTLSAGGKDVIYGSGDFQQFSEVLQKFSFGLAPYVSMRTDKGDTLALADYYVPNLYGMAKSTQVLLAFERPKQEADELEIVIEELGLGTGKQRFLFKNEDIQRIPELIKE